LRLVTQPLSATAAPAACRPRRLRNSPFQTGAQKRQASNKQPAGQIFSPRALRRIALCNAGQVGAGCDTRYAARCGNGHYMTHAFLYRASRDVVYAIKQFTLNRKMNQSMRIDESISRVAGFRLKCPLPLRLPSRAPFHPRSMCLKSSVPDKNDRCDGADQ
jgi:hypothetical protein